jgi:hypothetical protein
MGKWSETTMIPYWIAVFMWDRRKLKENVCVLIVCVCMAQFRLKAWTVTAAMLMINLKRAAPSFEVVSLLDCAFWHILFTLSLFKWPLRPRLFFVKWRRLPSWPSAWPHFLFILIHYVYVYVDLPFIRADDAIKWLFTHTSHVKSSFATIERNKLNLNFSIVSGRGEWPLCLSFVGLHTYKRRAPMYKQTLYDTYLVKEKRDNRQYYIQQFVLDFCVTAAVSAYGRTNDV